MRARNSEGYEAPVGISVDPVVLAPRDGRLDVLLVPRHSEPDAGRWALPGGFASEDEPLATTAQRKLTEKTGVGTVYLEQLATYGDPGRDPRGWMAAVAWLALIDATVLREDETEARWFAVTRLPPLALDHDRMIADGVERLRGKLWWSNIAVGLLPERFTLAEARRLYESITGVRYEVSNFRRTLEQSGLLRATAESRQGVTGRPARLYEFVDRTPSWSRRRSRMPATLGGS